MLLSVSFSDAEITRKINAELGKPYSLYERIKMWGNGSPKLILKEASEAISDLMNRDNNRNVCNIELRPKGIIVGFRSKLDSYALIIPYDKLVLSTTNDGYLIRKDEYFVEISIHPKDYSIHRFMKKLFKAKLLYEPKRS
ncbi:MAG: hypothetical protein WBA61_05730 [Aequorivita sp.]